MSLANSSMYSIIKKQYLFKLKSYSWFFFIMICAQIIGILADVFNIGGSMSFSYSTYTINIYKISTLQVFIFTVICIIGVIINLGFKEWKSIDFSFVSNSITSDISNIAFLITYGLFGSVTYSLSAAFVRIIRYLSMSSADIFEQGFFISSADILYSIVSSFFYILLFCSICYLLSVLVQKSKMFILVIFLCIASIPRFDITRGWITFYSQEHSLLMFIIKVLLSSILFFTASVLLSETMEVRR